MIFSLRSVHGSVHVGDSIPLIIIIQLQCACAHVSPGRHDGYESLMKRRTGQARAQDQPLRAQVRAREAEDKVLMSTGGVAGNGGSPAGRINAALE